MLPSHPHLRRYAADCQRTALAEAEHERRLALAAAAAAPAAPADAPDDPAPSVDRRLGLLPRLRLRRVPLAPWPEPRP